MLVGKKVYLRIPEPNDLAFIYTLENNPNNWLVSHTLVPYSKETLKAYIDSSHDIYSTKQVRFVICDLEDTPIGTIDLFDYNPQHQRVGIGVIIEPNYRKAGAASEALKLVIDYCFNTLILKNIYCNILDTNTNSKKLFLNHGFELIGIKKSWIKTQNGWEDEELYQLINPSASSF